VLAKRALDEMAWRAHQARRALDKPACRRTKSSNELHKCFLYPKRKHSARTHRANLTNWHDELARQAHFVKRTEHSSMRLTKQLEPARRALA